MSSSPKNGGRQAMVVLGTRPEAIKLAPVVHALKGAGFETRTVLTGQHREMVHTVVGFFGLQVDDDLDIMKPNQSLVDVTTAVLTGISKSIVKNAPRWVLVQGDTTTTFAASVAAFYHRVPVVHVEAGLRTGDPYSPFPEEFNRSLVGRIATLHCAPTQKAFNNLLAEGIAPKNVVLTGNTVADALILAVEKLKKPEVAQSARKDLPPLDDQRPMVLVTGHRRESFGAPYRSFCEALKRLSTDKGVELVFPVHLNPNVQQPVREILGGVPNIHLLPPVQYPTLVWLAKRSHFIITDSGGIQEEAAALGKPVLVTRETTERQESVDAGLSVLVGTNPERILFHAHQLLREPKIYARMARPSTIYGDGQASKRIADELCLRLDKGA